MKLSEYLLFCFMAIWAGVLSVISTAGAITAAIMAFGFGVDLICEAIHKK